MHVASTHKSALNSSPFESGHATFLHYAAARSDTAGREAQLKQACAHANCYHCEYTCIDINVRTFAKTSLPVACIDPFHQRNSEQTVRIRCTNLEFLRQCQTYPKTTVKLQSKLMKYVWDAKLEQVKLFHTSSQADLRRINSYTAKVGVAGRIWGILPTQPNLRMTDELMMQALRLQLGAMPAAWMYLVDDAFDCPTCQRKVSVRDIPSHSNHCAANRRTAITGRHDGAGGDLCCAATKSRVPYVWEQVMVDGKKPDITFLFPNQTIVVDVAIVAPEAPSKHGDGEMDPLSAAHDMANAKFKKYDDLSRKSGAVFMPAIFQTSGAYTLETAFLIKRICAAGADNGMENPMSPAELRDRLAITIQRGNAIANVLTAARLRVKLPAFAKAKPLLAARSFDRGRTARRRSLAWARQVNSAGD